MLIRIFSLVSSLEFSLSAVRLAHATRQMAKKAGGSFGSDERRDTAKSRVKLYPGFQISSQEEKMPPTEKVYGESFLLLVFTIQI